MHVTDQVLVDTLQRLAENERVNHIELLRYLGELDERKLYLGLGHASLWSYCREALKFSEGVSQRRVVVARAARRHPEILEMIGDGRLTLCTAADLAPTLVGDGAGRLLAQAAGKSRKEVARLAGIAKPVQKDVIRRLALEPEEGVTLPDRESPDAAVPIVRQPHAATRHRVAFTASDDVVEKLEKLQALLGDASLEEVIGRAADKLLNEVDPVRREARREARRETRKTKPIPGPRAHRPTKPRPTEPRRPPRALRDRILNAAGNRCCYVSPEGLRCSETRFLSIDHVRPYALGGTSTDEGNLRCLCMAHNQHYARQTFG